VCLGGRPDAGRGGRAWSSRHRALVDGIVRLARTLGLQVIAEGIETTADRDLLIDMGCRYGQGYLYSVPLASGDVPRWLAVAAARPTGDETPGKARQATA
jgi:EAL domain-containing protein (putative c-di-GMP-specific phosphodiesterase class I)